MKKFEDKDLLGMDQFSVEDIELILDTARNLQAMNPDLPAEVMHEGLVSTRIGLQGIPAASEENMVQREISLQN